MYDLPRLSEFFPFISIPIMLLQPQRFVTNLHTTNCTLRPSSRSDIAVSQKLQRDAIARGVGLRGALRASAPLEDFDVIMSGAVIYF